MLSSIVTKTLFDQRRGLVGWGLGIAATVTLMSAIWPSFSEVDFDSILDEYPDAMLEIFNVSEIGTPVGYMNAELFSILLPALFIIYGVGRGARLIAGEEEEGTLETLAALPITRTRILLEKAAALTMGLGVLATVLFFSTWLGSLAFDMDLPPGHILNGSLAMFLLGSEFGLISLAVSAGTGRRGLTIGASGGLACAAYVLFLMGQLVDTLEPFLEISPFHQAISAGPLGPDLPLLALAMPLVGILAVTVAIRVFDRRDLRV